MTAATRRNPGGGPLPRGRPSPTPRRLLVAAALASLLLGGCQSLRERNPFRGCCGTVGLGNLFHRNRVVYEEAPLYAEPGVEVLPGTGAPVIVEPAAPIGSVPIEPGFNPSPPPITSPDAGAGDALNLDPLDGSSPRPERDHQLAGRGRPESRGPVARRDLPLRDCAPTTGDLYADAMARRSEATVTRARPTSTPTGSGWDPPAVVPADAVANARPAAEPTGFGLIASLPAPEPADLPAPGPAAATQPEPVADLPAPTPSEPAPAPAADPAPADSAAIPEPAEAAANTAAAPPLARFDTVAPMIAAGVMPTDESGWAFLGDHGYRTVIDLRRSRPVAAGGLRDDDPPRAPSHHAADGPRFAQPRAGRAVHTGARAGVGPAHLLRRRRRHGGRDALVRPSSDGRRLRPRPRAPRRRADRAALRRPRPRRRRLPGRAAGPRPPTRRRRPPPPLPMATRPRSSPSRPPRPPRPAGRPTPRSSPTPSPGRPTGPR